MRVVVPRVWDQRCGSRERDTQLQRALSFSLVCYMPLAWIATTGASGSRDPATCDQAWSIHGLCGRRNACYILPDRIRAPQPWRRCRLEPHCTGARIRRAVVFAFIILQTSARRRVRVLSFQWRNRTAPRRWPWLLQWLGLRLYVDRERRDAPTPGRVQCRLVLAAVVAFWCCFPVHISAYVSRKIRAKRIWAGLCKRRRPVGRSAECGAGPSASHRATSATPPCRGPTALRAAHEARPQSPQGRVGRRPGSTPRTVVRQIWACTRMYHQAAHAPTS